MIVSLEAPRLRILISGSLQVDELPNDLEIVVDYLSMDAVRMRSCRSASERCLEKTPTKVSQPVFERISSKSD